MKRLLSIGILGLAGVVGAGLMALPGGTVAASSEEDVAVERKDSATELVQVSDDDDDDDTGNTNTNTGGSLGAQRQGQQQPDGHLQERVTHPSVRRGWQPREMQMRRFSS